MLSGMEVEGEGCGWQGNIDQAIFFDNYAVEGAGIQLIHDKMKGGVYYCSNSATTGAPTTSPTSRGGTDNIVAGMIDGDYDSNTAKTCDGHIVSELGVNQVYSGSTLCF